MNGSPWYREPWPWLLMAGPAAVVLAGSFTMVLAYRGADGLVADDYYTRGLAINRDLARERRALEQKLSAQLAWDARSGSVIMRLQGGPAAELPPVVHLTLLHPVRAALDHSVNMARGADGVYSAQMEPLEHHRWNVVVEASQWRLSGEWKDPGQPARVEP